MKFNQKLIFLIISPTALINLGVMAATHIPCDFPYFPIPYGCWCGITLPWPSPYKPIDDLDEACKSHDWCYEAAADEGCSIWDEYVFNYKWHDDNGEVSKPSKTITYN